MKTVLQEMTRRVGFIKETDDLVMAYDCMRILEVHHVPVVRDGKVVGILSDRDILVHSRRQKKNDLLVPTKLVADVMTTNVITCRRDTSIGFVATLMLDHKIHCIPVVESDGKLVGIITSADLIRLLRDKAGELEDHFPFEFEKPARLMEMTQ